MISWILFRQQQMTKPLLVWRKQRNRETEQPLMDTWISPWAQSHTRDAVPRMAQPTSSLSGTTRGWCLQEKEYPGCLVTSAAHIQLWGCCPSPLQTGACRDKSKEKAKTQGQPGSRLSGELVQRAGLAQKTCNWPSWAITCCKWRQKDSFDTTVKITLLEKKKNQYKHQGKRIRNRDHQFLR